MEPSSSEHQQFCLRWNNHRANLLTSFTELWHNGSFADVVFLVGPDPCVPLKCHKMVLAACSTYFAKALANLPSSDQLPTVLLPDVRVSEMKAILEFMYQGEVSVSQDEMADIFRVAHKLEIKGLMEYDKSHRSRGRSPVSPPPAITSTERTASFTNDPIHNDYRSPPHSTSSSPYYPYGKVPAMANHPAAHMAPAGWNSLSSLSLAAQSVMNAPLTPRAAALFPGVYEAEENHLRKQMNSLILHRDTPILRTVLGQGQADSSQGIPPLHGDPHDVYRSSSNGSAHDMTDGRRSSLDLSHIRNGNGHSPYSLEISMEELDKKSSMTAAGHQNRKSKEWKRYKQYTKEHMDKAIKAVKGGETALKASKAYGIPSRTLYDKVKKMGITTQRNIRRHRTTSSGAHFPHGIGGNRNGNIYRGMSDHDNDNDYGNSMMEGSAALLDIAYGHEREQLEDQEASLDNSTKSMSPDDEQQQEIEQEHDDHVQDLSINRRNVIVPPPSVPIKEENDDASKN